MADFKKAKENTTVSLQEAKRKKEKEEAEKKVANMEKTPTDALDTPDPAVAKAKKKKDTYLTEAGRVLADIIEAQGKAPSLTKGGR